MARKQQEEERNHRIAMLVPGTVVEGTVESIMPYGAFINLGNGISGLVHISQLADHYVSDPTAVVNLHQHVRVRVLSVDRERKRIQLSMKGIV